MRSLCLLFYGYGTHGNLHGLPHAFPTRRSYDLMLESLVFTGDSDWTVTVPGWRRDVDGAADLVEEVIRIEGIDKVAPVPLDRAPGVARPTDRKSTRLNSSH